MILIVDLLEVTVFAATNLLLFHGALNLSEVALMANQESIFTKIEICIIVVRLNSFARQLLAQELHLEHLLFIETEHIAVVRIRIRQGLDRAPDLFARRRGPRSDLSRVISFLPVQIIERLALAITKHGDQLFKFSFSEHVVYLILVKQVLTSL